MCDEEDESRRLEDLARESVKDMTEDELARLLETACEELDVPPRVSPKHPE